MGWFDFEMEGFLGGGGLVFEVFSKWGGDVSCVYKYIYVVWIN